MEKLAKMAMLRIEDVEDLKEDVLEALAMADILEEVEACENFNGVEGHLREDEEVSEFAKKELLKNAPFTEDSFFVVPKIVG